MIHLAFTANRRISCENLGYGGRKQAAFIIRTPAQRIGQVVNFGFFRKSEVFEK